MYLQSLLAAFCFLMGSYSEGTAQATTMTPPPEENPQNFADQDAEKVVKMSGQHWVKERTYNVTTPKGDPKCEYARIVGVAEDVENKNYTLELGARFDKMWTSQNQTLVLKISGNHTKPNVMEFSRTSADGRRDHKLLYSNYANCSIVRISRKTPGAFCDLLLLGSAADSVPPSPCKEKFEEYCKGVKVEVYASDCRTQQQKGA